MAMLAGTNVASSNRAGQARHKAEDSRKTGEMMDAYGADLSVLTKKGERLT